MNGFTLMFMGHSDIARETHPGKAITDDFNLLISFVWQMQCQCNSSYWDCTVPVLLVWSDRVSCDMQSFTSPVGLYVALLCNSEGTLELWTIPDAPESSFASVFAYRSVCAESSTPPLSILPVIRTQLTNEFHIVHLCFYWWCVEKAEKHNVEACGGNILKACQPLQH